MRWLSAVVVGLSLVLSAAAQADEIRLQVMVSRISEEPGGIDARAGRLHQKLSKSFRYESLEVLDVRELRLGLNQLGTMALPGGKSLRVLPLQRGEDHWLLSVEAGDFKGDLRVRNGRLVVIGDAKRRDGVVISVEPRW